MSETKNIIKHEEAKTERRRQIPIIAPIVDIFENDDEILLHADMPGVAKDAVNIKVDNGTLEISGSRTFETPGVAEWEEFSDVQYKRTFSVPQSIDVEKVNAELKNGVLMLHLPKSEVAKPRQIKIH